MYLILVLLFFNPTSSFPEYDVGISVESAFLESCVSIEPLFLALDQLKRVQASLLHYSKLFKGQSLFLGNMGLRLQNSLESELTSIELKLEQFGYSRIDHQLNRKIGGQTRIDGIMGVRNKRGAFDFVSEGASYLFGFVSASQYRGLKKHISDKFSEVSEHQNILLRSVSENRDHLNNALASLNTLESNFQSFTKGFSDMFLQSEHFLGITIQISFALSSVQSLVSTLEVVRNDADHFYPSRYITPREKLKSYILHLSDSHSTISPVFSSLATDNYYRYKIATTTSLGSQICQILRVPMIGHYGKFKISHTDICPSGRVCLSNVQGHTQVSVSEYASCLGVHFPDLPTLCSARPCLTDEDISCIMLNHTTALIASKERFQTSVNCVKRRQSRVDIVGILAITIPLDCFILGPKLKIDKVQLMKTQTLALKVVNLPFTIHGDVLIVNDTAMGGPPIFENSRLSQLVLPKLKSSFNRTIFSQHSSRNSILSTSATVASGVLLLILAGFCLMRFYNTCLKPKCCPTIHNLDQNSGQTDDHVNKDSRKKSTTVYDPTDSRVLES